jgi:hypothetical protein
MSEIQTSEAVPVAAPVAAPVAQSQPQLAIRDADLDVLYANFFRVTGNPDEVLLDLGMFSQVVSQSGPEPINLTHRVVVNFVTAKKLAEVLRAVVARHEQAFGIVEIDPNRRGRK